MRRSRRENDDYEAEREGIGRLEQKEKERRENVTIKGDRNDEQEDGGEGRIRK